MNSKLREPEVSNFKIAQGRAHGDEVVEADSPRIECKRGMHIYGVKVTTRAPIAAGGLSK